MKTLNPSSRCSEPTFLANAFGKARRSRIFLIAVLGVLNVVSASAEKLKTAVTIRSALQPGDIICADSGNGIDGGFILKVDPATGLQTVISSGGNLQNPFDVAFDADGQLIVSDASSCCHLIRVDPTSGQQTLIEDTSRQILGAPLGLVVGTDGTVLVANAQTLVHLDPASGIMLTVSSNGNFVAPLGVAFAGNGGVFVLNQAFPPQILRVDLTTGRQIVVSSGGLLHKPQAIVGRNHDLYVTDVADPYGNVGIGRVIHIDSLTGVQTVVSEGGNLVGPVGITVGQSGQIVVGDPYTINPSSPDLFDGGIIMIDPQSGAQRLIARGRAGFLNPRGVAIVPGNPPSD